MEFITLDHVIYNIYMIPNSHIFNKNSHHINYVTNLSLFTLLKLKFIKPAC